MVTEARCLAAVFALLAVPGCSKGPSTEGKPDKSLAAPDATASATPADATASSVSISSLLPDPQQPLRPGTKVRLKAEVEYVLPSQGGMVGIVIQGTDGKPIESALKPVPGGSGKVSTEIDFVVPNAKTVSVYVPLYIKGQSSSVKVTNKQYQVAGK